MTRRRAALTTIRRCLRINLCFMLAAGAARAQVNVEPIRKQLNENGFGARLRLSLSAYRGNNDGIVTGASALVGGRSDRHLGFFNVSGDYAHFGHTTSVKKSFAHLRHNYEIHHFLWWEEFLQSETDRFRRIHLRALAGTGPRFGLVRAEVFELYLGTSYMLEYTRIASDLNIEQPATVQRWNNYAAVTYRPHEHITFSNVIYYQPRFDRFSDSHVLNVTGLEFKVTELLQSRLDATLRYESVTPQTVRNSDLELKSSLELKF